MNLPELMIALSLSTLLCVGVFDLFGTMQQLHQREMAAATMQENTRFLTQFIRDKMHMAGNCSCLPQCKQSASAIIQPFNADDALSQLGVVIHPGTDLLRVYECVRLHDHFQYLPIDLFVADTFRKTVTHEEIDALFYKIDDHPREELITGLIDFHVHVIHAVQNIKQIRAVRIAYLLSSIDRARDAPQTYWFDRQRITASDLALYQPGVFLIACRNV